MRRANWIADSVAPAAEPAPPPVGSWATRTPYGTVFEEAASALIENKVYIFGGSVNGSWSAALREYDIIQDSWATLSPTGGPGARGSMQQQGVACRGKFYVYGGYDGATLSDFWVYDPAGNTWTQLASGVISTHHYGTLVAVPDLNKMIYVRGTEMQEYDVANDTWTDISANMVHDMTYQSGCYFNGEIYFVQDKYTDAINIYDPAAGTWRNVNFPPLDPNMDLNQTFILNGKLHIILGANLTSSLHYTWDLYNEPESLVERALTPAPRNRAAAAASPLTGKAYILGGQDDNWNYADTVFEFTP